MGRLKDEEFQKSRQANIKRAEDPGEYGKDKKNKIVDHKIESVDKIFKEFANLFGTRSLEHTDFNRNSNLNIGRNRFIESQGSFGKRGKGHDVGSKVSEDSEMLEIKREILEILRELEGKKSPRNYIEEYLEHKRELERKNKIQELISSLDEIINNEK